MNRATSSTRESRMRICGSIPHAARSNDLRERLPKQSSTKKAPLAIGWVFLLLLWEFDLNTGHRGIL